MFCVLGAEQRGNAFDGQLERRDFFFRQLHVNLTAQAALGRHRRDAFGALEPRADLVLGHLAQRHAVVVALDAEAHDRHRVRVLPEDLHRLGVDRHAPAHAIEAHAHVVHRLVEVRAPRERERHAAAAFRRGRVQLVETRHRADRLLDRPRNQLLDFLRADARIPDEDADRRIGHVRQQVDRKAGD